MFSPELIALSIPLGIVMGLVLGLTGAGGSILAAPLLMLAFNMPLQSAAPIALMAVCLSASVGTVIGLKQKMVRYRAASLMAIVGAIFAPVGVWLSGILPPIPLLALFLCVLAWVAKRSFAQAYIANNPSPETTQSTPRPPCRLSSVDGRIQWNALCVLALSVTGSLAGCLGGLLGVGGGFVIVPALQRFTDIQLKMIVNTSLMVVALSSLSGMVAAMASGKLLWGIGLPFALGAVAGLIAGKRLAQKADPAKIHQTFAIMVLFAMGILGHRLWTDLGF